MALECSGHVVLCLAGMFLEHGADKMWQISLQIDPAKVEMSKWPSQFT